MTDYSHQDICLNEMKKNKVGQIIIPIGGGKSMVEFKYAKSVLVDDNIHQIVIIVAPRIILCQQLIREFYLFMEDRYKKFIEGEYRKFIKEFCLLIEDEDKKLLENEYRKFMEDKYEKIKYVFTFVSSGKIPSFELNGETINGFDIGKATTKIEEIAHDIKLARDHKKDSIVFSTYASFDRCVKGIKYGSRNYEDKTEVHLLADEAHYFTRGSGGDDSINAFRSLKENLNLFKSRFFFTATPRSKEEDSGSGMNNKEAYGDIIYEIKPNELIKKGVICEPRLHKVTLPASINNENFEQYAGDVLLKSFWVHEVFINRKFEDGDYIRPERIGAKILVAVSGSKQLFSLINNGFYKKARDRGINVAWTMSEENIGTFYNGEEYKTDEFLDRLKKLCYKKDETMNNTTRLIVLHYDQLTEGIDIPSMTGLMVLRDMNKIKKVQNIGRVLRVHPEDKNKDFENRNNWIKPCSYVIVPNFEGISCFDGLIEQLMNEYDANIEIETSADTIGLNNEQPELQNVEFKPMAFKVVVGKIFHNIEHYDKWKKKIIKQVESNEEIDFKIINKIIRNKNEMELNEKI